MRNLFDLKSNRKNTYFKTYTNILLPFAINTDNLNPIKYLIFSLLFKHV